VILDRDGVINEDSDRYIKSPEEWVPIPGSLEAIARLRRAEYRVAIATNQSAVARGLMTLDTLNRIHTRMLEHIERKGGAIDAVMVCPHGPDDGCSCRKPRPGMLLDLANRLNVNLLGVPMVGDSIRDLEAACAVGATPVLVRTGKGEDSAGRLAGNDLLRNTAVYENLAAFTNAFLHCERNEH
jgi:D-glycero-D-manno-heptose 1,7-bisphosphate phosphatase